MAIAVAISSSDSKTEACLDSKELQRVPANDQLFDQL